MALQPVVLRFVIAGLPQVQRAMRTVADAALSADKAIVSSARSTERLRATLAEKTARETIAAMKASDRATTAALRAGAREAEKAAAAEVRAARLSAAERIRIETRVAAESRRLRGEIARGGVSRSEATNAHARLAILQNVRTAPAHEQRAALERVGELRISDLGEKAEARSAQRTAREKIAAMKLADREAAKGRAEGIRENERAEAEKNRSAMRWVRQREREVRREQQETSRRRERFASAIVGGGAAAGRTAVRGATALARTALDLGGGFQVQDVLHDRLNLEREASLLSNTTSQGEGTRVGRKDILETVRASSVKSGVDEAEMMKGLNAYVAKTGDYKGASKNLDFYGKVSKATGASVEDVMRTAGAMAVQNKSITADELKQLTLSTVMQSRKGSVEFSDMAQAGAKITRTATGYVGNQAQLQSELLGLSQVGMRTEGNNVSAAATDLANVQGDAMKHRGQVRALLGHDFMNEKGQIQGGPSEFIAEMLRASGGNMSKLADAGIGKQAMKTFQALAPTFNEAQAQAKKEGKSDKEANAAGKAAVLADIKDVSAGKYDEKDLEKDFAEVMRTSAEQFEGAVRQLKQEVGDKLVPALIPLVQIIRDATPTVGRLLTSLAGLLAWAEGNPLAAAFAGVGLMVGKAIISEFVSAKVGEFVKSLLSGGGGGVPGGGSIPGGKVGKGLAVVTAAVVGAETAKEFVDSGFSEEKNKDDARRSRQIEARNLASAAKNGPLSTAQAARARELAGQLATDKQQMDAELDPENQSLVKKVTGTFGAVVGGKDFEEAQQIDQRNQMQSENATADAMNKLLAAIEANTRATEANSSASSASANAGRGNAWTQPGAPHRMLPMGRSRPF